MKKSFLWPRQIILNPSCSFVPLLINIRYKMMTSRTHSVSPTLEQNQEPPTLPLHPSPTFPTLPPHYLRTFPTLPPPHYPPLPPTFLNLPRHCRPTSPTLPPNYPSTHATFPTFPARYPPTFPIFPAHHPQPFPPSHYLSQLSCSLPFHLSQLSTFPATEIALQK